jgi:hypothetical protein
MIRRVCAAPGNGYNEDPAFDFACAVEAGSAVVVAIVDDIERGSMNNAVMPICSPRRMNASSVSIAAAFGASAVIRARRRDSLDARGLR